MTKTDDPLDQLPGMPKRPSEVVLPRRIPVWLILAVVLVVLGAAGGLWYFFWPLDAPVPAGVKTHYANLERGTTEDGFPRLGSADAPVVIENFTSYACPHCRNFHEERLDDLLDEIVAGDVQFVLIPITTIGPGAENAAEAAMCAGEQGMFWEMSDVLFDWQKRYTLRAFDGRRLEKGAENLGLDRTAFAECMDQQNPVLARALTTFRQRGLKGTPTFFINGSELADFAQLENLSNLADQLRKEDE